MREWPEDWQVSLGAVGGHFSFTKAELDGLTLHELAFWLGTMSAYLAKVKAAQK